MPEPEPADDELLIRVGRCRHLRHRRRMSSTPARSSSRVPSRSAWGPAGALIPGHEFAGTVVGMGRRSPASARVTWSPRRAASPAGNARGAAGAGPISACPMRRWACSGTAAWLSSVSVPARSCAVVDRGLLTPDAAALASRWPIAVHAAPMGGSTAGLDVLVIGAGGIGAFLIFALAQSGARVTVVERSAVRRKLAWPGRCRHAGAASAAGIARLDRGGLQPELVYEVTGSPARPGTRPGLDAGAGSGSWSSGCRAGPPSWTSASSASRRAS